MRDSLSGIFENDKPASGRQPNWKQYRYIFIVHLTACRFSVIIACAQMTGNDIQSYAPLLLHLILAMALSGALLFLSSFVGWRRPSKVKSQAYECGIPPPGDAREPFSVKFYLVAMIFILFDVE